MTVASLRVAWPLALAFSLVSTSAFAQFGPMGPPPMQPGQGQQQPKPDPKQPQTHAAPGGEDLSSLPSAEAQLPTDPLSVSSAVKKRIGSDAESDAGVAAGAGVSPVWTRRIYPPYYEEQSGAYRFRTIFPLWFERTQGDDTASLFGPLYYRRRSPQQDADVVFPLYWDVRNGDSRTHVVGPLAWRRSPGEQDNWLAPLIFQGSRKDGGYLHIPPLLTYTRHDQTGGFNMVGPAFCSWKGGSTCSLRTAEDIDFGIAPFYFYGRDDHSEYEIIPPLLHYYSYEDIGEKSLNIWGPLLWKHTRDRDVFDVMPFFWHIWGPDEDHVTVLPFFHYGHKGKENLFVNPLFLTATGPKGEKTFATWGYARYRGRTELDMITPFYWDYRDPDIGAQTKILFPFLYSSVSPRGRDFAVFPFWGHFERYGVKETTFITPFIQHSHGLTGWETNIHPILYLGRNQNTSHTVVFPFFWDFASPKSRTTVGFPVYWRFDDGDSVSQLALNTYYHERKLKQGLDWEFHFFPAFSYGETPDGHWWKVLYGLAGYTRKGVHTKMYAAWIPFTLSEGRSF
ncbi:MAG: hypothetical protein HY898_13630 [Deltaproteobacteria bacterium]|nr:hypothetical protein [Deltaproteobacteria bacterium]